MAEARIAAQLYTLRDYLKTPADQVVTLQKVAALGYKAVQMSAVGPHEWAEFRQAADDAGLTICATHIGIGDILNETAKVVDQHAAYGCQHVGIGGLPGDMRSGEGFVKFVDMANEAAEKLAAHGLTFSYHNHSFELERFGDRTGLQILIEDTAAAVCFEIDTFWIQHGGGDPAAWIDKVSGRCPLLHYKDLTYYAGGQKMAPVGSGNLNWQRINAAAASAGAQWLIVEQDVCEVPPTDPFDALAESFRNLQAMGLPA